MYLIFTYKGKNIYQTANFFGHYFLAFLSQTEVAFIRGNKVETPVEAVDSTAVDSANIDETYQLW